MEKTLEDYCAMVKRQRNSIVTDLSEEEMWNKFLIKKFPIQVLFDVGNKVVDNKLVESTPVFAIVNRNFEIIEQVTPVFNKSGNFTKEVQELKAKKLHKNKRIETEDTIDSLKVHVHTDFALDREIYKFKFDKESSDEYKEFSKWCDKKGQEYLDSFLKK